MIKIKQLGISLILIVGSSFLIGCGENGPKTTRCINSPFETWVSQDNTERGLGLLRCFSFETGKNLIKRAPHAENMVCVHPFDSEAFQVACARKVVPPLMNECIFGASNEDFLFHCFNAATQTPNLIPYDKTENYVCLSPGDAKQVKDYCRNERLKEEQKRNKRK